MSNAIIPESPARRFNWVIYLALVLVAWAVNYPGRINSDTLTALTEAQHLATLRDWQSPVVTWLLSPFAPVLGQPAGALLVQALLLFVYPAITLSTPCNRRINSADAVLAVAFGAFLMALIAITGEILKDTVLIGAILCLCSALDLRTRKHGAWLGFTLAMLLLIATVRPTNFLMLGIAGIICAFFVLGTGRKFLLSVLLILVLCGACIPVAKYINRSVLGAHDAMQESSLIIFDVAGISSNINQNLFAQLPGWSGDDVQHPWDCYTPERWDAFKWGACKRYAELFTAVMQKPGAPSPVAWWFGNVLRHPVSYLKHRISYTVELFKNATSPIYNWGEPFALNSRTQKNLEILSGTTRDFGTSKSTHGIDMTQNIQMWEPSIVYMPFGWVAARIFTRQASLECGLFFCAATLLWSWHTRRTRQDFDLVVVVASALGIGNVLMMMVFGVADEGRYLAATLVCGIISLLRISQAELETWKRKSGRV